MNHINDGLTAVNGSILLAVMLLTIISMAEDAFYALPREFKEHR